MVMSVLSQPNHPARLGAIFAATLGVLAVLAAAAYAGAWVWQDVRSDSGITGSGDVAQPAIDTGGALIVMTPVDDAAAFEDATGFAPFIPERVPAGTQPEAKFAVTPPDEDGGSIGRVAFSALPGYEQEGISGPVVVISQGKDAAGSGVDGQLKQVGDGRALSAAFACGDLVLDVQLYFSPDVASGELAITPYIRDLARAFVSDVRSQCE